MAEETDGEELFVPGRICLFGEHSDWAGGYRRMNSDLAKGHTIITGTNQGLYARVKPHEDRFIYHAAVGDSKRRHYEVDMEPSALKSEAENGGFFSYAAGVAYQIATHHKVKGLEIDNYRTTLPLKKGLSSSAAACVLVARGFDNIYDLKLTTRGEMEYAYKGEITTPSRCGRMDQGCAYGSRPIHMIFDGDLIDFQTIAVGKTLYYVIVDLKAGKDTIEILGRLNECYPFPAEDKHRAVQEYLGPINAETVRRAITAFEKGNTEHLGELMQEAQQNFDQYLAPMCPSELDAPVLHKVLSYEPIQPHIYGGKCVGSGGDGTAQMVARNENSQKQVVKILEKEFDVACLELTVDKTDH
ncbi:MAG: GHMP kinase [Planctomycetes bacterium]|nr:GHMP kinase [Planctomycetota bacterium]